MFSKTVRGHAGRGGGKLANRSTLTPAFHFGLALRVAAAWSIRSALYGDGARRMSGIKLPVGGVAGVSVWVRYQSKATLEEVRKPCSSLLHS